MDISDNGDDTPENRRSHASLRSATTWRELIIIGAMAMSYAALALELIGFFVTFFFTTDKPPFSNIFHEASWNTFTICAAIAFGLSSMFVWYALVLQANNYSRKSGLQTGLVSTILAQPLMIFFWALVTIVPTLPKSNPQEMGNSLMILVGFTMMGIVVEFFLTWVIWLPSLAFGAFGGWLACLFMQKIRTRSLNVHNL